MRLIAAVRNVLGLLVVVPLLLLLCSLPVQLIMSVQTIILKPIAYLSLGEGWEAKNTVVLGSGMGLGIIIATRDEHGNLKLARGGYFGFDEMK